MDYRIFNVRADVKVCNSVSGCTDTVRDSAVKVDSWRKIPRCIGDLNLHQLHAGPTLCELGWGCSSVGRASDQHHRFDSLMQQGIFLPEWTFCVDCLTFVHTSSCAIACVNISANVKDPVVPVWVWLIMETQRHPACTLGWVVWLCHSWFSSGKATQISHWRNHSGTKQL